MIRNYEQFKSDMGLIDAAKDRDVERRGRNVDPFRSGCGCCEYSGRNGVVKVE